VNVFGKTKVGGIFVCKIQGVVGRLGQLHKWKIYSLYSLTNKNRMKLISTEHVNRGDKKYSQNFGRKS
jgi:hypothetical protein